MKKLARNVVTTYVARFANVLGLFFLFPLVGSAVPQAEYGVYLLTASLVSIFAMDLGMAGSTTRFVSMAITRNARAELKSVMATSWVFFAGLGLVGGIAVVVSVWVSWNQLALSPELIRVALVCSALAAGQVLLASSLSPNRLCLAGAGRLDVSNMLQIGQILLRFALTALLLTASQDVVWVSFADLTTIAVAGAASWWLRRWMVPDATTSLRQASKAQFVQMFGLTRDFLVMNIAALVVLQAGNVIVGLLLAPASIAIFSAAQRIYQVARELTNSLTAALLPAATSNHATERAGANADLFVLGTKYSNALLAAALPPLVLCMPTLVSAWLGVDYATAALPAAILVASMFVNNQHLVAVPILGGQGDLRVYSRLHACWALGAIGAGWWLTGTIGVTGMALAIAAPLLILEPFYVSTAVSRLKLGWRRYFVDVLARPFLPALALVPFLLVAGAMLSDASLVSAAALSGGWVISYVIVFYCFSLSACDRRAIWQLIRRGRS